ncbi:MAG: hypothetical protein J0I70_13840 [Microbacterium sp.]|uniref:hypothetical protein n=1 Tax=Microbacterium sp. TaxID=51671 RepID=UPI000928A9A9|nr:hypothetical protein [Microbacterium sp.]MBN9175224.1 hypothetical protein [Microbacterium sp.]MBN9189531.1 hypothetical protein [Microbacterium sp.]MBN9194298.1 hypothetical protein [Microbacterium sp.]OJU57743.1 MAG: hypothetical protein BGO04_02755 [Microbacterium sp. 70-38]
MTSAPDDDAETMLAASRGLLGLVVRSLAPALKSVRIEDYRVLELLASRGDLEVRDLAEFTGMSALRVDESLRRLSAGGRIAMRGTTGTITPGGHALVDEVTHRRRAEIARLISSLSSDDRGRVREALVLITEAAGEPPPEQLLTLGL